MSQLKPTLPAYKQLQETLQQINNLAVIAKQHATIVLDGADAFRADCQNKLNAHTARTDLRPHFTHGRTTDTVYFLAFNTDVYHYGPLPDNGADQIPWFWEINNQCHETASKTEAMLAIVSHWCNGEIK